MQRAGTLEYPWIGPPDRPICPGNGPQAAGWQEPPPTRAPYIYRALFPARDHPILTTPYPHVTVSLIYRELPTPPDTYRPKRGKYPIGRVVGRHPIGLIVLNTLSS